MQFSPRKSGYEAGIVIWWSQYSYASYGLTLRERPDGEQVLTMASRVPTGKAGEMTLRHLDLKANGKENTVPKILLGDIIQLRIETTPTEYSLSFEFQGYESTCRIQARDLTVMPPIGGAFCGAMFGVYSFGRGEPVLDPADFFDFIIKAT
ncbi:hypothetical protein ANO14919_006510 [Xylariales sp. No.14919]|nr:hypothetical protein ANO14919_006510 [Xylariales sp. No.14919]